MSKMRNWVGKFITWYQVLFNARAGQAVVQGVYIKYPYFIKQHIARAFQNDESSFNVGFNVVPYDSKINELGTYFKASFTNKTFKNQQYDFNVYGLKENSKYMQFYDSNNNNILNNKLNNYTNDGTPNIVIN
jgi:hypothetical protein